MVRKSSDGLVRMALGALGALLLAGCASGLPARQPLVPSPVPVAVGPQAIEPIVPDLVIEGPAWNRAFGDRHPDLLTRIRAGFQLGDLDEVRIDREATWYASHPDYMERTFTRAAPYLHHIVVEIESRGLPLELALLPVVESAFEPYAYSRARAAGLWQFIPGTGTRFGLKQDWWYDGRRDVVAATTAALDYLEFLHNQFGDWLLAVAAYNCGEHAVARQIARNRAAGKPTDFWNLKLPKETRAYVPKLLAMSRLVANPDRYGLAISPLPNAPYFARVETGGQIDLRVAAELAGITTEELYALNPAYHRWATDPAGPHYLLVPVEAAETFRENLLQLTPDQRMRVERYEVRSGDTVASIAKRFATTTEVVRELNGLAPNDGIQIGAEIRVPSAITTLPPKVLAAAALVDNGGRSRTGGVVHVVRKGDSLWKIARRNNMDVKTLARLNGIQPGATLRTGQRLRLAGTAPTARATSTGGANVVREGNQVTYTVRRGDTLYSIAKVLQVSIESLREWNSLGSSQVIRPGQKLVAFVTPRT
jgi:membrane-bound lytic murein transglycosylase D